MQFKGSIDFLKTVLESQEEGDALVRPYKAISNIKVFAFLSAKSNRPFYAKSWQFHNDIDYTFFIIF